MQSECFEMLISNFYVFNTLRKRRICTFTYVYQSTLIAET